jgi:nitrogen fixation NifU-like protein
MDELRELYQATILDHNKKPRNFRAIEDADRTADGHNPLCGDKLTVYLTLDEDGRVSDVSFQGSGCAISTASASLMTELVKGKTVDEIEQDFQRFHEMVTSSTGSPVDVVALGKLAVFSGVREYPMRVKCASLAWHTLRAAIEGRDEVAKTE